MIPVGKEQHPFPLFPPANCSILLVTLYKPELVCDHDIVLFLLDVWSILGEVCGNRLLSLCCPRVK